MAAGRAWLHAGDSYACAAVACCRARFDAHRWGTELQHTNTARAVSSEIAGTVHESPHRATPRNGPQHHADQSHTRPSTRGTLARSAVSSSSPLPSLACPKCALVTRLRRSGWLHQGRARLLQRSGQCRKKSGLVASPPHRRHSAHGSRRMRTVSTHRPLSFVGGSL